MKILIVGSGGREDAFAWKFQQEANVEKIYVAPGNPGMKRLDKVEILPLKSNQELFDFAKNQRIDLTFVGPEAPLTEGIADLFQSAGLPIFGPNRLAAQLEGSKIFSKNFMKKYKVPTAAFEVYENFETAMKGLNEWNVETKGIVIKADGLAGGKGVVVTKDRSEAEKTLNDFMINNNVSVKTERILFEEILPGDEVSAFAFCNGQEFFFLGCACDHKRVFDNDKGPNTGGMGCYRDPAWPDKNLIEKIKERVLLPTLNGCKMEGHPFTGVLFMGLMVDEHQDPYVVEYNVRFGDPECQTLLPLLKGNLSKSLLNLLRKDLGGVDLTLSQDFSCHVVATSGGYPTVDQTPMSLGHTISVDGDMEEGILFYAGVKEEGNHLLNSGGRVLGVTSTGNSRDEAREKAYKNLKKIQFKDMHFRKDIGQRERGAKVK